MVEAAGSNARSQVSIFFSPIDVGDLDERGLVFFF